MLAELRLSSLSIFNFIVTLLIVSSMNHIPRPLSTLIKSNFNNLSRVIGISTIISIPNTQPINLSDISKSLKAYAIENEKESNNINILENENYKNRLFNIPPQSFQYPSYFSGTWSCDYNFQTALFTPTIPFQQIATDQNIAGFRKYSILKFPDVGSNYNNIILSYEKRNDNNDPFQTSKMDSVYENIITNTQNQFLIGASKNKPIIDNFEYNAKTNPNRVSLAFRDSVSYGRIELFCNSRSSSYISSPISSTGESFRTIEFLRQSTSRQRIGEQPSQLICDYAIENIYNPINTDSSTTKTEPAVTGLINGQCRILSYITPQDNLYFQRPLLPVCMFSYDFKMTQI